MDSMQYLVYILGMLPDELSYSRVVQYNFGFPMFIKVLSSRSLDGEVINENVHGVRDFIFVLELWYNTLDILVVFRLYLKIE